MLKPTTAVAALLSAFAFSVLGGQAAAAAVPTVPLPYPATEPTATPVADGSSSSHSDDRMAGVDHETMPGMDHDAPPSDTRDDPPAANHDAMPGMDHDETSGTTHEEGPSGEPGTPAPDGPGESHAHSGVETATEPRPTTAMVGGFAAVNGVVLISAAILRQRDKRATAKSSKPARQA